MTSRNAPDAEDPLVAQAFDPRKHDNLARAIEKLSPDEAAYFLHKLEHAVKKRKLQLTGYLAAMGAWLVGMIGALLGYGSHGVGYWIFAVPFALVGAILYFVGRHAEAVGARPGPPPPPGLAKAREAAAAAAISAGDRTET